MTKGKLKQEFDSVHAAFERLVDYRKENKISRYSVAKSMGYKSSSNVKKYEDGERTPSYEWFKKYSAALGDPLGVPVVTFSRD